MHLNIFQVLPYRDPKNYQAIKLFPNETKEHQLALAPKLEVQMIVKELEKSLKL